MKNIEDKREQEKKLVGFMIRYYCHKLHAHKDICPTCQALLEYSNAKSDKCPFMETKTFCSNCKVHCYKEDMREQIKKVMRYSGPRMLLHHPIMAIKHMIESAKEKRTQKRAQKKSF